MLSNSDLLRDIDNDKFWGKASAKLSRRATPYFPWPD
jgi:hypothetical protein